MYIEEIEYNTRLDNYFFYGFFNKYKNYVVNPEGKFDTKNVENVIFTSGIKKYDIDILESINFKNKIILIDPLDYFYITNTKKIPIERVDLFLPGFKLESKKFDVKNSVFTKIKEENNNVRKIITCFDPIEKIDFDFLDIMKKLSNKYNVIYCGIKAIKNEKSSKIFLEMTKTKNIIIYHYPIIGHEMFDLINCSDFIITSIKNPKITREFPIMSIFAILNNKLPLLYSPNRFYKWFNANLYLNEINDDIINNLDEIINNKDLINLMRENINYAWGCDKSNT